jgi:AcrR family transcriptional regulator
MPKVISDEEVYRATVQIFVERGYEGATTKEIAAAAGIHEATLFRKYGSKSSLIERAIQHQFSDVPLARLEYTGDLEADLLAIVAAYMETNEQYGEVVLALLTQIPRHPDMKNVMAALMGNIDSIVRIIQRYQAQERLKQEFPLTTLTDLIAPLMVTQVFRRALEELAIPPFDPQEHVAFFLNGKETR